MRIAPRVASIGITAATAIVSGLLVGSMWPGAGRSLWRAIARADDLTLTCELDGPLNVKAGQIVEVPLALHNLSRQAVPLTGVNCRGPCGTFDDFPSAIGPGEARALRWRINSTRLYGTVDCAVSIGTGSQRNPEVSARFTLQVSAERVSRLEWMTPILESCTTTRRELSIQNVPGRDAVKATVEPGEWRADIRHMADSEVDLEIGGPTPRLGTAQAQRLCEWNVDLDFSNVDPRILRCQVKAWVLPEWDYPEAIAVNPISAASGRIRSIVLHRRYRDSASKPIVDVVSSDLRGVKPSVPALGSREREGIVEERFGIDCPPSVRQASSGSMVKLRLRADDRVRFVEIPVIGIGRLQ